MLLKSVTVLGETDQRDGASPRLFLASEFAFLFVVMPGALFMRPTWWNVPLCLWLAAAYAAFVLSRTPGFAWHAEWQGQAWSTRDRWIVLVRACLATLGVVFLTMLIEPDHLFSFPAQRPVLWLTVMLLYPMLSVLPQELLFRSFFFSRYAPLFPVNGVMIAVSAVAFGSVHIIFHNTVSPLLSCAGGYFLASSYQTHASLKRVTIEHAFFGNMVFTVGLGHYFVTVFH